MANEGGLIEYVKKVKSIMWTTWTFTGLIGGGLMYVGHDLDPDNFSKTLLVILFGIILGWVAAFLTSPYDKDDSNNLEKFSKIIGSFISGYLLSKFDKVSEAILDSNKTLNGVLGIRIILLISFFFLTWLVVYATRQYFEEKKPIIEVPKTEADTNGKTGDTTEEKLS
jgi:uncharacterized membrane protein YeaQ/YmgE (transglycosylase-associated protein family)